MSNRRDRRKAASVRRHARPASRTEQRQLLLRVGVLLAAVGAVIAFFAFAVGGGR